MIMEAVERAALEGLIPSLIDLVHSKLLFWHLECLRLLSYVDTSCSQKYVIPRDFPDCHTQRKSDASTSVEPQLVETQQKSGVSSPRQALFGGVLNYFFARSIELCVGTGCQIEI